MYVKWFLSGSIFGKDFEKVMSRAEKQNCAEEHYQILSYQFGALKLLVLSDVDCADFDKSESNHQATARKSKEGTWKRIFCWEKWRISEFQLKFLWFFDFLAETETDPDGELKVAFQGDWRRFHMVELATRSATNFFPGNIWLQLYFDYIPTLIMAYHRGGLVKDHVDIFRYKFQVRKMRIWFLNVKMQLQ